MPPKGAMWSEPPKNCSSVLRPLPRYCAVRYSAFLLTPRLCAVNPVPPARCVSGTATDIWRLSRWPADPFEEGLKCVRFTILGSSNAFPGSMLTYAPTAPGLISTRMGRQGRNHGESAAPAGSSALFSSFVGAAASLFMGMGRTPAHGAETTLHALLAREMGGRSADGYFLQPYYSPRHQQHPLLGGWGGVAQFELVRCSFLCLLLCSFVYSSLFSSLYLVQIGQRLTWGPHLWIAHPDAYNRSFGKELWTQSERAVRLEAK